MYVLVSLIRISSSSPGRSESLLFSPGVLSASSSPGGVSQSLLFSGSRWGKYIKIIKNCHKQKSLIPREMTMFVSMYRQSGRTL